jgi:hypothetical protein
MGLAKTKLALSVLVAGVLGRLRRVLNVEWYRFRVTFSRRWRGDLALLLLIGIVGGLALGSLAAARRTASSFPVYLKSTDPSDLSLEIIPTNGNGSYSAALTNEIAHLPHVKRVEAASLGLDLVSVAPDGLPSVTPAEENAFDRTEVIDIGSINGLYFDQDRVTVVQGTMANPRRADEAVLTPEAAQRSCSAGTSAKPFASASTPRDSSIRRARPPR